MLPNNDGGCLIPCKNEQRTVAKEKETKIALHDFDLIVTPRFRDPLTF